MVWRRVTPAVDDQAAVRRATTQPSAQSSTTSTGPSQGQRARRPRRSSGAKCRTGAKHRTRRACTLSQRSVGRCALIVFSDVLKPSRVRATARLAAPSRGVQTRAPSRPVRLAAERPSRGVQTRAAERPSNSDIGTHKPLPASSLAKRWIRNAELSLLPFCLCVIAILLAMPLATFSYT